MLVGGRGMDIIANSINPPDRWLSALIFNTACPAGNDRFPWRKQEAKEENAQVQVEDICSAGVSRNVRRSRIIPPFVLSCDAARGALYSLQASLSYALMLAVM